MSLSRGALVAASLAALVAASGTAAADPSPFGLWARGDGKVKVRVQPCGGQICAVNTWVREGTKGERPGDKLFMAMKPDDPGRWTGTAFDPKRDRTYKLVVTVGEKSMVTHGCIVAGLVCKDMGWTRLAGE